MYDKALAGAGVTGAGLLPFTGSNVVFLLLAAFALLACGAAVLRIVPRPNAGRR